MSTASGDSRTAYERFGWCPDSEMDFTEQEDRSSDGRSGEAPDVPLLHAAAFIDRVRHR